MNKSFVHRGLGLAFIVTMMVSQVFAAPDQARPNQRGQGRGGFAGWGRGGGFGGGFRGGMGDLDLSTMLSTASIQRQMLDFYKQQLEPTEEEWTVIEPRLFKVLELSQDTNSLTGVIFQLVNRVRSSDWFKQRTQAQQKDKSKLEEEEKKREEMRSAVQKALEELQETVEKEAPTLAEIKARIAALRGAREKVKNELVQAQSDLREVLTLKQEAALIVIGLLE